MRDALALAEPELDTSIGSPTRKIIDAVAVAIAPAYADQQLQNYAWDIDAKSGADLDDFVAMFGMARFPARRATGTLTFSRGNADPTASVVVPFNTQAMTVGGVLFQTAVNVVMFPGQASVDVPVQAVLGGAEGNVGAQTVTVFATQIDGVTTVINNGAMTGGAAPESDDALRTRFKSTVFRSMAGTEAMFIATALEAGVTTPNPLGAESLLEVSGSTDGTGSVVTAVNVIGASKRWREQVMFVGGVATSAIPASTVKMVYDTTEAFGTDIDGGDVLIANQDYQFGPTVPPTVTSINPALDQTAVYDLDFEYVPLASRNDPASSITNRVDVWVAGEVAQEAQEIVYTPEITSVFSATAGDALAASKFVRLDAPTTHPTVGNYFMRLTWGPIVEFPSTLTINGTVYTLGTDYWVVHDDTAFGYSPTSLFGIEWLASRMPAPGTQVALTDAQAYAFNLVPNRVERAIRDWRLVTVDARAHAAKVRRILLNLAVIFTAHTDRSAVISEIKTAVANLFASRGFDSTVQASDILSEVTNVRGVDAARFLRSAENSVNYAAQWVNSQGTVVETFADGGGRVSDILLGDDTVAVLHDINITVKTQNTWGGV